MPEKYKIGEKIGEGGFGIVYKAKDRESNKDVAIKYLKGKYKNNPDEIARFFREAETMKKLKHPNIVPVLEINKDEPSFIMPYYEKSLWDLVQGERKVPIKDSIIIAKKYFNALNYAHSQGVIHGDIWPANILIDNGNVYLSDFGLGRFTGILSKQEYPGSAITDKIRPGQPAFMAPELTLPKGERISDEITDIFSASAVFYYTLTGEVPILRYKDPSKINPNVPKKLEEIILKGLEADRKSRYQDVKSILSDINEAMFSVLGYNFLDKNPYGKSYLSKNSVLKTIEHADEKALEDLSRRVEELKKISHPNIAKVIGFNTYSEIDEPHIEREYIQGKGLQKKEISRDETKKIFFSLIHTLEDISKKHNFVYGNLKPSNIIVTKNGIKITDIGLYIPGQQILGKEDRSYYHPSILEGQKPTEQTDIYSIGAIAYEMLKGEQYRKGGKLNLDNKDLEEKISKALLE